MVRNPETARGLIESVRVILCNLDGCLTRGRTLAPGAAELAELAGARLWIVSNNSTHDQAELSVELSVLGIAVAPERIALAGMHALDIVHSRWPRARVLMLAAESLERRARALGLTPVADDCDVVLLARDPELSFARLDTAVRAAARGRPVVIANPDTTHPREDGQPTIESGSLAAALRAAVPNAQCIVVGKPEASLFRAALTGAGGRPDDAVMIGDTPATDIAGAMAMGIAAILIGCDAAALAPNLDALLNARGATIGHAVFN